LGAGIIDMPNGKRYIGSVFVKRPHNDYSARTLIQEISRTVYQHFKWYTVSPTNQPQKKERSHMSNSQT
jgi:beta-lactamase class A